jgi:hypothetical protein
MVNQDQIVELRDYLREHGSLPREELVGWLLGRGKQRYTPQMRRVMAVLAGERAAAREFAIMEQDEERCRSWAGQWLARQALHVRRAQRLEADRWRAATKGTIRRWFVELDALFRTVRPEMVWDFDELMVAAGRAGKAVVTGNEELFSPQGRNAACDSRGLLQLQGGCPSAVTRPCGSPVCAGGAGQPPRAESVAERQSFGVGGSGDLSPVVPVVRVLDGRDQSSMAIGSGRAGDNGVGQSPERGISWLCSCWPRTTFTL